MRNVVSWFSRPLLLVAWAAVVAVPHAWSQDGARHVYTPDDKAPDRLTTVHARGVIEKELLRGDTLFYERRGVNWGEVKKVLFGGDRFSVVLDERTVMIPYEGLRAIDVVVFDSSEGVRIPGHGIIFPTRGGSLRERAIAISDSLYTLGVHHVREQVRAVLEESARLDRIVAQYIGKPRPEFPEEARRSRVQAEFSVEKKRWEDAARFYGEALRSAPWWSEGYFNRALVLGEIRRNAEAVGDMKRFLALEPNHAQARAAQDQIYRWESVTGSGSSPIPQAGAASKGAEPCRTLFGCARQEAQR